MRVLLGLTQPRSHGLCSTRPPGERPWDRGWDLPREKQSFLITLRSGHVLITHGELLAG